jgi:hypothetical protein
MTYKSSFVPFSPFASLAALTETPVCRQKGEPGNRTAKPYKKGKRPQKCTNLWLRAAAAVDVAIDAAGREDDEDDRPGKGLLPESPGTGLPLGPRSKSASARSTAPAGTPLPGHLSRM